MKILVCISNVPDTTTRIKLAPDAGSVDLSGVQWIINPWDELSLTRAVELKEKAGDSVKEIVVATVGPAESEATLRKALAIGADKAYRVDSLAHDAWFVASQLADVCRKVNPDVVFAGIESSDFNGSAVGGMLAEILGINSVSSVTSLDIESGRVTLHREMEGSQEQIAAALPLVVIVQKGIAIEPRIPAMRGIMMARQKPLEVLPPTDVQPFLRAEKFELPQQKAACRMIEPEQAAELIQLLHKEAKVI